MHNKIRENLHQSPLYSGKIKGIGPRYCPSIEDKVVKFADKNRHQLFLEPEGHNTNEVYLNGFSTSLPSDLQQELVRMIPGMENARIIRPGYAIEYDFVDPRQLQPTMETVSVKGLFFAGQINGTTGYEEAACQGLMAGINAALQVSCRNEFRLRRDEAYIGVLIDDLIQHGVDEPYRIFTSRAEARLTLRHDNADLRLSIKGREIGLVGDNSWERFHQRRERIALLSNTLNNIRFKRSDVVYATASQFLNCDLGDSFTLAQLAQRPNVDSEFIFRLLPNDLRITTKKTELDSVIADSIYKGYIESQQNINNRVNRHDALRVPDTFEFHKISGLSYEMIERLQRSRPQTFGQARKIPGITHSALSTLLVHLSASDKKAA